MLWNGIVLSKGNANVSPNMPERGCNAMTLQWLALQAYRDIDQDNILNILMLGLHSTVTEDF